MIYADRHDPIADLMRAFTSVAQPTQFVVAGGYCYVPDDGEEHYLAHEAAAEGFHVVRYPVAPTHASVRVARTALGAGLLR